MEDGNFKNARIMAPSSTHATAWFMTTVKDHMDEIEMNFPDAAHKGIPLTVDLTLDGQL